MQGIKKTARLPMPAVSGLVVMFIVASCSDSQGLETWDSELGTCQDPEPTSSQEVYVIQYSHSTVSSPPCNHHNVAIKVKALQRLQSQSLHLVFQVPEPAGTGVHLLDILEEDIDLEVSSRHNPGSVANAVAEVGCMTTQDPLANDGPPTDTLATNRSNSNLTITDPLVTNTSSTNKALDIDHFF
ncbi:hypothetical protein HD554DRAFT_2040448 [Boletus coccyginus]|nr:hypothetical protein HD554DRAFT_2040448 [Boletus coccyginus]